MAKADAEVVVAGDKTMNQKRSSKFDPKQFKAIIVDEAQNAEISSKPMYFRILRTLQ